MSGEHNLAEYYKKKREGSLKDREKHSVAIKKRDFERRKREMADLVLLPRPAENLQNGAGFIGNT